MDDAEQEWRAHGTQIRWIKVDTEKNHQEVLATTNQIEEAVMTNNHIFADKWESTHERIDHWADEHRILKTCVIVQQTICWCHDWLLSPGPHYTPGEEEEMVEEEEEEEEDKDGLEYKTDVTSQGSYTTPLSTGGHSKPSPAPSCLPSSEDSNPEANVVLCTAELEACIESFLEEVEGDLELDDLPLLENITLLLVLVPTISGFVPFTVSTSQHCVLPKSLLRKVYHPYKDPVG